MGNMSPATCYGGEIKDAGNGINTLGDILKQVHDRASENGIVYIEQEGKGYFRSYGDLIVDAERVLAGLRALGLGPGDKAIMQFDCKEDFISVFWGCVIGGIVPVPIAPARNYGKRSNEANNLYAIWETLEQPYILTNATIEPELLNFSQQYAINPDCIQAVERLRQEKRDSEWHISMPDDLALLLFTSGSTGKPKGVMLTHGNIVAREKGTVQLNGFTNEEVSLNWMPLEHVGGLVMFHLRDMYTGCKQVQVKTEAVLTEPRYWLDLITDHRCTVTWAPSFAYGLVVESVESHGGKEEWDLSTMRFILNGGEQVNPKTSKQFLEFLAPYGLPHHCMKPAWGMSETCSGVVYSSVFSLYTDEGVRHIKKETLQDRIVEADKGEDAFTFVEIGRPIPGVSIRIVDRNGEILNEENVGRLQLRGACVTKGYYNQPELNEEVFDSEGWFDTGDVGFIKQGRLTITGRSKEEIVVNGINISSYEVEAAIEQLEGVETSYTAVCTVKDKRNKEEVLVFFVPKEGTDRLQQIRQIIGVTSKSFGIKPKHVIPLTKEQIPKTSIGKIQRKKLVEQFKRKEFRKIIEAYKQQQQKHQRESARQYSNEYENKLITICREVLKADFIHSNDNLFEMGASSIEMIQIISRIHMEFSIKLEISEVFKISDIESLAKLLHSKPKMEYNSIERQTAFDHLYPVSTSQSRMYTANQLQVGLTYNVTNVIILEGKVNSKKLNDAFAQVVARHEPLRTSFSIRDNQIVQKVHMKVDFHVDFSRNKGMELQELIRSNISVFQLDETPLIRVSLIEIEREKYLLIVDAHHIIMDGTSVQLLLSEALLLYRGDVPSEVGVQHKDYVAYQRKLLKDPKDAEAFWYPMFSGELPVLNLNTDYPRPPVQHYEGGKVSMVLPNSLVQQLKETALQAGTTLYMLLLSSYYVLLSKYTSQEDIIIGTLFNGRTHPSVENCIGMFVNTVPLRGYPEAGETFRGFLSEVETTVLKAMEYQYYPFERIIEHFHLPRDMSRNPLFDTVFILHDEPELQMTDDQLTIYRQPFHNDTSRVDLTLEATTTNNNLLIEFEYSTNLFKKETIQRMIQHYINILKAVVSNKDLRISQFDILSNSEKYHLLQQCQIASGDSPIHSFLALFEKTVSKSSDRCALVNQEGEEFSYGKLKVKSDQLARSLQMLGVNPGVRVAIMLHNSFDLITGMLAVMKAGGTFLLIDPQYPKERKLYMLSDSDTSLILTTGEAVEGYAAYKVHDITDENLYLNGNIDARFTPKSEDPAYIMYTSGSTGQPKGVLITYYSLNNFIQYFSEAMNFDSNQTIVSITSVSFDPFIVETLLPLAIGMKVVIAGDEAHRNPGEFSDLMVDNHVDILQSTPSRLKLLLGSGHTAYFKQLSTIMIGGEHLDKSLLNKLRDLTDSSIFNIYGPTETTIWSAIKNVTESDYITVGKPLKNMSYYILNSGLDLLPIGVIGELCIAGSGLSLGYLNQDELNHHRFVPNPFKPDERMYRTGDYARMLDNGEFEIIGRNDDQVKIRGYRIELKEIERCVLSHSSITEAVVLAEELASGIKTLCVYYVAKDGIDLRNYLSMKLPDYMLPNHYVRMEALPLTVNGKVDRRSLPTPTSGELEEVELQHAPWTETESVVYNIFKEVLEINKFNQNKGFFELGGHSLTGLFVISRVNKFFQVALDLKDLFTHPTVAKLSNLIEGSAKVDLETLPAVVPCLPAEHYDLSYSQSRMYTLDQIIDIPTAYNIPHIYRIKGHVDSGRIEEAIRTLINRHNIFRTSFSISEDGTPVQRIHDDVHFEMQFEEMCNQDIEDIMHKFVQPFDLKVAPLLRSKLVKARADEFYLLLDVHHIVMDATSMMIMLREIMKLYRGEQLPALEVDYKDFCIWEKNIANSDKLKRQEHYWINKYARSQVPYLELPTDFSRPMIQSFAGDCFMFSIDESLLKQLKNVAEETNSTLFMVLLVAYKSLLAIYSNQSEIVVGTPVSGRWQIELKEIIGMFSNTLAIQSSINTSQTLREIIETVKESTIEAFSNQEYPFDKLVNKMLISREKGRNPLFDTMFVLQPVNFSSFGMEELKIEYIHYNSKISRFDLLMQAYEDKEKLYFIVEYSTKLFKMETIQRMLNHFQTMISVMAKDIDTIVDEIDFVSDAEEQTLMDQLEVTAYDF